MKPVAAISCPLLTWLLLLPLVPTTSAAQTLEVGFAHPPQSAGIRCWWWWLNGNVTREAITRDLEEMQAKGFSGACIFDAGGAEQRGNDQVPAGPMFGTPAWRDLFKHAVGEADRLGLVLSLNIQSGWNLGGPDVTPEEATKHLTWSEIRVSATNRQPLALPRPKTTDGFYRDIAVLAYPVRAVAKLEPATNRPPVRNLREKAVFTELGGSAPDTRFLLEDVPGTPGEEDTRLADILEVTAHVQSDGRLNWRPPSGEWVVLRFGYTCSEARVSTSSGQWQGRVIDPLSADLFRRYWNRHVEPLLQEIGPRCGRTLKYLQTDSWEGGGVNWTDDFAAEFRKRRGYDLTPYLPVVAGKIIENRDVGTRFLADFRKTISDCFSDNHYRIFAELARPHGLGLQPESAGPHAGPFDGLKNYGHSEIMMSEFWVPSPHRPTPDRRFFVKQAASAAHIYDRRLVGAESFTSIGPHWNDTLWSSVKPSFDHEVCSGLNLVLLHTFTCSPMEMGLPGQEYFAGTHFNPQVTWWSLAGEPIRYLNRCQWLLQRGGVVADVLYYYGDHVPNIGRLKQDDPARALPGFDYDLINEDVLLTGLTAKDGRLTLPHGPRYRLLVLPDHRVLSLGALRKVRQLVQAGATVIGPKTERIVSLTGYPQCDAECRQLAETLWGESPGDAGERKVGNGRVIWGRAAREVLWDDGVAPDFEATATAGSAVIDYIHRTFEGTELYFICNQTNAAQSLNARFRVAGREPELWDALTDEHRPARAFRQENGRTWVPVELAPYASRFVLFRKAIPVTQQGDAQNNSRAVTTLKTITNGWDVRFDPRWGGPAQVKFDPLVSWTERPETGVKFYSGTAVYRTTFSADVPAGSRSRVLLDLGDLRDVGIARVRLNGRDCGITWTPPFRVDITSAFKPGSNELEIEVVNSWRNRLVGDRDLPAEKRFTRTNIRAKPDWTLLPAGLLGPVTLLESTW